MTFSDAHRVVHLFYTENAQSAKDFLMEKAVSFEGEVVILKDSSAVRCRFDARGDLKSVKLNH